MLGSTNACVVGIVSSATEFFGKLSCEYRVSVIC